WTMDLHQVYSAEDLKLLLESSRQAGLAYDPERLVERSLDFSQLVARHVMGPRTEMVAVPVNVTMAHLAEILQRYQHSRYPVYDGSTDNIVGILSVKNLAGVLAMEGGTSNAFDVRTLMRAPLFVPETM